MKEARDMVGISVPFVAGVASAAMLGQVHLTVHSISILAFLLLALAVRDRPYLFYALLFWTCGLFVYSSYSLCVIPGQPGFVSRVCQSALDVLKDAIDSVPFEKDSTSALLKALLSGDRSGMDKELVAMFRKAGASHILALSGLHLGLMYLILSKLLWPLGNSPFAIRLRGVVTVSFCAFYTVMTGASPSVTRAFIFICLNELARCSPEREKNLVRELLAAALIQLSIKPDSITTLGFQLSYLAMAGIALLHPVLREWYPSGYGSLRPVKKLWDAASLSISCQAFTAPLCWLRFRTFPVYFLITNLIAMPLTSVAMGISVFCILLHTAGLCPHLLVRACELTVQLLLSSLEIISSL